MMFPKLTVWHSALRKACDAAPGGRLQGELVSHVQASTYKGRPPYVEIKFDGDNGAVRKYQVETDEIEALLNDLPLATPIWIEASGAKGTPLLRAGLVAEEQSATPEPEPTPDPQQQEEQPEAASHGSASARPARRRTHASELKACLLEARRLRLWYVENFGEEPTDAELRLANALHIQLNKEGGRRPLSRRPATVAELRPTPDT